MTSNPKKPSEFELIAKYFAPLSGDGSFGLSDDAAEIIPEPNQSVVVTQDAVAASVHFFEDDAPAQIAQKAVRVNLSDLAAKGAEPKSLFISLGLKKDWSETWVSEFAHGLAEDCAAFQITIGGGDTFSSRSGTIISITAIGTVPSGQYTSRLSAKPGDLVFVTGTIGDAAAGLMVRSGDELGIADHHASALLNRYVLPQPRIEALELVRSFATASMDVSDGLVADAEKLAKASDASLHIQSANVPLSEPLRAALESESVSLENALSGGDDYEILFTINPDDHDDMMQLARSLPFPVTQIGTVSEGEGASIFDMDGQIIKFSTKGYDHSG